MWTSLKEYRTRWRTLVSAYLHGRKKFCTVEIPNTTIGRFYETECSRTSVTEILRLTTHKFTLVVA